MGITKVGHLGPGVGPLADVSEQVSPAVGPGMKAGAIRSYSNPAGAAPLGIWGQSLVGCRRWFGSSMAKTAGSPRVVARKALSTVPGTERAFSKWWLSCFLSSLLFLRVLSARAELQPAAIISSFSGPAFPGIVMIVYHALRPYQ